MNQTFTERLSSILYVHSGSMALIYMLTFGAIIELFAAHCGFVAGTYLDVLFHGAGIAFLILALFQVWGIVRFEQQYHNPLN